MEGLCTFLLSLPLPNLPQKVPLIEVELVYETLELTMEAVDQGVFLIFELRLCPTFLLLHRQSMEGIVQTGGMACLLCNASATR